MFKSKQFSFVTLVIEMMQKQIGNTNTFQSKKIKKKTAIIFCKRKEAAKEILCPSLGGLSIWKKRLGENKKLVTKGHELEKLAIKKQPPEVFYKKEMFLNYWLEKIVGHLCELCSVITASTWSYNIYLIGEKKPAKSDQFFSGD